MIAATAVIHGLTVVTRNIPHFESFGVDLLNPFSTDLITRVPSQLIFGHPSDGAASIVFMR